MTTPDHSQPTVEIEGQTYSLDSLIPPRTACRLLNVSERTLRRMTQRGDIPAFRYNAFTTRYQLRDLINFLTNAYTDR